MIYTADAAKNLTAHVKHIDTLSIKEIDNGFILPLIRNRHQLDYYKGGG